MSFSVMLLIVCLTKFDLVIGEKYTPEKNVADKFKPWEAPQTESGRLEKFNKEATQTTHTTPRPMIKQPEITPIQPKTASATTETKKTGFWTQIKGFTGKTFSTIQSAFKLEPNVSPKYNLTEEQKTEKQVANVAEKNIKAHQARVFTQEEIEKGIREETQKAADMATNAEKTAKTAFSKNFFGKMKTSLKKLGALFTVYTQDPSKALKSHIEIQIDIAENAKALSQARTQGELGLDTQAADSAQKELVALHLKQKQQLAIRRKKELNKDALQALPDTALTQARKRLDDEDKVLMDAISDLPGRDFDTTALEKQIKALRDELEPLRKVVYDRQDLVLLKNLDSEGLKSEIKKRSKLDKDRTVAILNDEIIKLSADPVKNKKELAKLINVLKAFAATGTNVNVVRKETSEDKR